MIKLYCYPQDGKRKSYDVCEAFAEGCGGEVVTNGKWRPGHTFFYGISESNEAVWQECRRRPEFDWFYSDNAYYDDFRGRMYRVARNRLQHSGEGFSDGTRFKRLGLTFKPWRQTGTHILLTPQSRHFMQVAAEYPGDWTTDTEAALRKVTTRPIVVREWSRDKVALARGLPSQLVDCWALVTYSSGSAITALLAGIPVVCTAASCVTSPMSGTIDGIEAPYMPKDRERWGAVVADQQWTLDEFRNGTTWRAVAR